MKTFTTNCLIAAAAMVIAAGSASAQGLVAEIPFSFQAGGTLMAPGTYQVTGYTLRTPYIRLSHQDSKKTAMLMVDKQDAAKAWVREGTPKLAFNCADGRCQLAQVFDAGDRTTMLIRDMGRSKKTATDLTMVTIKAVKAE